MLGTDAAIGRFIDLFQIIALACLIFLCIGHAVVLYAQGIRVVVIDRERSVGQVVEDLVLIACVLLWSTVAFLSPWFSQIPFVPLGLSAVLLDTLEAKIMGAVTVIAGLLTYGCALWTLGQSWRVGIDRNTPGPLVTKGVFSWTRNPIYVSLELFILGIVLAEGIVFSIVFALLIIGLTHALILREERFLVATYGDAYREYCRLVGRYANWRRLRP